jgi:hypothetical protein
MRRAITTPDIAITAVLLRPDGHICWLTSAAQPQWCDPGGTGLHAAIERWFEPGVTSHLAKPGCQRWVIPRSGTVASS